MSNAKTQPDTLKHITPQPSTPIKHVGSDIWRRREGRRTEEEEEKRGFEDWEEEKEEYKGEWERGKIDCKVRGEWNRRG